MNAVDLFVILDDVKFSKGGWINRNRILVGGKIKWVTAPISSTENLICDKTYLTSEKFFRQLRATISQSYSKTAGLSSVFEIIDHWEGLDSANVSEVNMALLRGVLNQVSSRLPEFIPVSSLGLSSALNGQERVIAAVKKLNGSSYVNLPGGRNLYAADKFADAGVELTFVSSSFPKYPQQSDEFIEGLSILDALLMAPGHVGHLTGPESYELIPADHAR
jgi:hypothetical protein